MFIFAFFPTGGERSAPSHAAEADKELKADVLSGFLFELKREDRVIKFFCPEKHEKLDTAVWYFCIELYDESGEAHTLPGQVRVEFDGNILRQTKGKPKFVELLEQVKLATAASV